MQQRYVFALILLLSFRLNAQKEDYTWIVGTPAAKLDFTDTSFTYDTTFNQVGGLYFAMTSFTENDSAGNLLYYTDGANVYDRHGNLMENGDSLNPSTSLTGAINSGVGNFFLQGAIGVQKPGSDSLYYLFHFGVSDYCPGLPVNSGEVCKLFLSIIDMHANNGLGAVIEKNHVLMQDTIITPTEMTLIKHGNGKDWWLIKHGGYSPNRYYKFLVTADAITGPFTEDIGSFPTRICGGYGTAAISPDGSRFAGVSACQNINIFDFDRCTGLFSNPDTFAVVDSLIEDSVSIGTSLAFSPNSRFLYVDYLRFINQYDLYANDVLGSAITLSTTPDTANDEYAWLQMQLAPDGKIYIGPYDQSDNLSVIIQPDSLGLACGFQPFSVANLPCPPVLNSSCSVMGLPLFPQYRLPTMPIYLADAGTNKETCKDTMVQLGSTPIVPQLIYTWSSNDPNAVISNAHSNQTTVSTRLDSAQFYLFVVDTLSQHSCLERGDTVTVYTNLCTTGIMQTTSPLKIKYFPYLYVYDIPPQTQLNVYDLLGQPVYTSPNYQNNWDVKSVTNGVYIFQLTTPDGQSFNGKVVVVH